MSERNAEESIELTVPFHDCDPLFVVWHGHYYKYLGQARTHLFQQYGLDVPNIRQMGYRMYVTETRCRYMFPLTYNDRFRVTARFSRVTPLLRITYTVTNLTEGRKSARARTDIATTDAQGNLLTATPEEILELIPS
jgi:acyl-CoA thioester hydrolase